jgi:hypothetical protein
MAQRNDCPICGKRKPERFCPAKGEKICAVCCGTEREVTLDCPADCSYLIAAHRYEQEHRKPITEMELPFRDVEISRDLFHNRQDLLSGLSATVADFSRQYNPTDPDVLAALSALAETYRTLSSGILYEKPPTAPLAYTLYAALGKFVQDYKKEQTQRASSSPVKDSEIFQSLVFLARLCRSRTNERPRARIFVNLLLEQFPAPERQPEVSRIIVP